MFLKTNYDRPKKYFGKPVTRPKLLNMMMLLLRAYRPGLTAVDDDV